MIKIYKDGLVECPICESGCIKRYYLNADRTEIYICEECDELWIDLNDAFQENKGRGFVTYLESRGIVKKCVKIDWNSVGNYLGYVMFDDVKDIVKMKGIEVVVLDA